MGVAYGMLPVWVPFVLGVFVGFVGLALLFGLFDVSCFAIVRFCVGLGFRFSVNLWVDYW